MDYMSVLKSNEEIFFRFMREKYPFFYNSNIFFRDIQYSIISFFKLKNSPVPYADAEKLAVKFIDDLEKEEKLIKVSKNTWKVNFYLDKPVSETEEPAELAEK